jgi:hypothetical protein
MDAKADPPSASAPLEDSLVRGGPFFRAQNALGLIRPNQWNLGRRIAVFIAVSWLPLFLITAVLNPSGLHSLLIDFRVHSRLLVAVPALLVGEMLMETRFRAVFTYMRMADLLEAPDMEYMNGIIARLVRLRDAFLPECVVLILLIIRITTSYRGQADTTLWMGQVSGAGFHFTAAGWYAVLVCVPLWDFMLGLGLWRWLMWIFFSFKLSRRDLKLVPTHPDKRGGLGFLSLTIAAFAPIAFAVSSVISSTWRHDILRHGVNLTDYKLSAIVFVLTIFLIALGPLLFFVPRLAALRCKGMLEYGALGQLHSAEFENKWIEHRTGREADFLQAPEINTLSGFGNTYEKIIGLKPFPADLVSLYGLAIAMAVPALFVILTRIPLAVVLQGLFKAMR